MGDIFAAVVDIETTGLSARDDVPLEIGVALIDKYGDQHAYWETIVFESTDKYHIAMEWGRLHEIVGPMHEESGLWKDIDRLAFEGHEIRRADVDATLAHFISDHVGGRKIPMMGSSIGSLDRPFVIEHFPMFNETLSYRNIDISSLKELCRANHPKLFENIKDALSAEFAKKASHRVQADVEHSIAEYVMYRENFFFTED